MRWKDSSPLRSVAFRQAVVYALLFSISVTLLAAFFYWSTAGFLTRQAEDTIEAEAGALAERYRTFGLTGLSDLINERLQRQPAGPEIYLLMTPDYRRLAGNLSGWPDAEVDEEGWARFRLGEAGPEGAEAVHRASAKLFDLPGGFHLLVGRDMQELEAMRATVVRALVWGLGITVLMALAGGALMGHSMSSRIGEINRAIRRIMAGDLSQRMPGNRSGDEFDRLTDNLNLMLDRIEGLMDGVRQVSDNIAHDLKTPLARMRNRLEELQRHLGGDHPIGAEDARRTVEEAIREADALLGTFGALLRIARIEMSARREGFSSVDLAALVGDVAELYEPLAEERGQRLEATVSAARAVRGDRDLLFQALANMVDNAIKYAPDGGRIRVTLRQEEEATVVSVIDNGPGVAPEDREHVFKRFWRADDSRTTPGSGLGLSLVEAVAALHGGEVDLDDARPGLEVRLRLPVGAESAPD
ncbi:MAG: HAMP domain-containing sensor histidine kinase [Acidobacteriota bacterium]